ncbi:MAG: hypothetical protein AB1896_21275 [Thermodesulfobacteriota bacterium]
MPESFRMDLTSLETYRESCLRLAEARLGGFSSIGQIASAEAEINAYGNLDRLADPRDVFVLDEENVPAADLERAREAVLAGRVFWEHAAAGEATRLKLGTKYLILPPRDLAHLETIARMMSEELGREVAASEVEAGLESPPDRLWPLNLGQRHLLQLAYDLRRLAGESGEDPGEVLSRQTLLLIMNEGSAEEILVQTRRSAFFGFSREKFLFMVQPAFPGLNLREGRFFFDPASPRRLHNHGQMVMQQTADGQVFRVDESGRREYLGAEDFARILGEALDKISYNIEDLDYLTGSVDWPGLALALRLGGEGYDMVMEIVANDPENPIKGGLAAYDEVLCRNVMIESFQLKGLPNEKIRFLNKNFNHYPNPVRSWRALKENGLPLPVAVKGGYLYFQPVQGDINFLVRTAFVRRKKLKPIRAWKSVVNTLEALNVMRAQERQPGFREFAEAVLGRSF